MWIFFQFSKCLSYIFTSIILVNCLSVSFWQWFPQYKSTHKSTIIYKCNLGFLGHPSHIHHLGTPISLKHIPSQEVPRNVQDQSLPQWHHRVCPLFTLLLLLLPLLSSAIHGSKSQEAAELCELRGHYFYCSHCRQCLWEDAARSLHKSCPCRGHRSPC